MTLARPTRSSANASGIDARISAANAAIAVLIMLPRRDPPCLYPVQQSSSLCPARVAAALGLTKLLKDHEQGQSSPPARLRIRFPRWPGYLEPAAQEAP